MDVLQAQRGQVAAVSPTEEGLEFGSFQTSEAHNCERNGTDTPKEMNEDAAISAVMQTFGTHENFWAQFSQIGTFMPMVMNDSNTKISIPSTITTPQGTSRKVEVVRIKFGSKENRNGTNGIICIEIPHFKLPMFL